MDTLKSILDKSHSNKTKAELIELLSGIEKTLTPDIYQQISGVKPSELDSLTKKEILGILDDFKENYNSEWENAVASASTDAMKMIFDKIDADDKLFKAAASASSSDFAAELGSIDFASIIGGPLDACVKAQANASVSTLDFINEVAYETDNMGNKSLRMAEFQYQTTTPNPDYKNDKDTPNEDPSLKVDKHVEVPFISLLNIPTLRIETCEVDFNVKLNSTYTRSVSDKFNIDSKGSYSSVFSPVKFSIEVSYQRTSSTGTKVEKEYDLGVHVTATNDEMPAGLEKVLGLLAA